MTSTELETISATLAADVLHELDLLDASPPQDEYAGHDAPPAYDNFEDAYTQWRATDRATLALAALEKDPAIAAAEKELKDAKKVLKDMNEKSGKAFKALHSKQRSLSSLLKFGKSKRKSSQGKPSRKDSTSESISSLDGTSQGTNDLDVSTLHIRGSGSVLDDNDPATQQFRLTHEAEMRQDLVVQGLEQKVAKFQLTKDELRSVASAGNLAWSQLLQIAQETAPRTSEFATAMGEILERLEGVENALNVAKNRTADIKRARMAVQSSHSYFTRALQRYDSIGGPIGGVAGPMYELNSIAGYRAAVVLASKAQICLNEVFRVLDHHEHMIPEGPMVYYKELKSKGVMQMSKLFNLVFGGTFLDSGKAGSIRVMRERQEAAFANLTYLAVWIQNYVPVSMMEEENAAATRDVVRRELASFWDQNIDRERRS